MGTLSDIEADWPVIDRLLDEALALPATERETWLASLKPEVARHRDTLRELLALKAQVETEHFMDAMPVFPGLATLRTQGVAGGSGVGAAPAAGQEVGPYRLLRLLGEGGMGAVWLAERADGTLKRKVALKLPRLAWSQDLASRMARERDILAPLEHPNIARLYDAGVDVVGRPWLALEFVEGSDLASFCDTVRLDLRARVRLFLQVLSAVQYAHGSLVIHRDLKPANILVTPQGEARLLDFGIARLEEGAADAGPALTRDGRGAMTPRYASPEQVRGGRLTVASDLYSLGVVLHELLTGETPYTLRRGSRAEYEQAILESDLRVPSRTAVTQEAAAARSSTPQAIARALRGDLDAVLMRALAPAPEGRYASAAALRDDLERWLEGRPVSAVPPSRTYALRKFIARNRIAVAVSAAAALALVAVSVVAVLQAQRAERSAAEARAEAARANATKEFLISTYASADPTLRGGRDATAKELLIEAEKQLDTKLKGQPDLQAEVLGTVQVMWDRLGDVERAQTAADRRADVLLSSDDRMAAAASVLSSAETAIKRRAFDDVERHIVRVESLMGDDEMTPQMRARLAYVKGASAGERGDTANALENMNLSVQESRRSGDRRMLFLGLVSRIFVRRLNAGDDELRRDIAEAESLLPSLDATPVEALGNRFQLTIARYILGDYVGGWREMQRIVYEMDQLYGKENPASLNERTYWLRYCLRLGESGLARVWLRDAASSGGRSVLREYERDPQWHFLVARVYMADRDWSAAMSHLNVATRLVADIGQRDVGAAQLEVLQSRLTLLRAELELWRGRPAAARALLSSAETQGPDQLLDDAYARYWVLGLAARSAGQAARSVGELRRAEQVAVDLLGSAHPDVALIRVEIARSGAMQGSGMSDEQLMSLMKRAAPVLRSAFTSAHPAVALVADLEPILFRDDPAQFFAVRRRLAAVPSNVMLM